MSFKVIASGCEALNVDAERVIRNLQRRGFREAGSHARSGVVVVMGCTFTQRHEDDFRQLVEGIAAQREEGQLVIVSGCFLEAEPREGVVFARKESIGEVLDGLLKDEKTDRIEPTAEDGASSPFVAISEGCYGSCTFCSIRFVRGHHRSRPADEVLSDVRRAADAFGRAKLVGQEIAAYGKDIGTSLPVLIRRLFGELPGLRLELGSLGPAWIKRFPDEDFAVFADERIKGNVHLPIQSASDSVLRRMARAYSFSEFTDLHERLKRLGVQRFSTDLIAGFPGETQSDHEDNLRFLEANGFRFAQIFMYEPRPGTAASGMEQIPRDIRLRRTLELIGTFAAGYEGFSMDENLDVNDILNTNIEIDREEVSLCEG
jgi:MiaB/RimO family radical SAM methylthiotransferase